MAHNQCFTGAPIEDTTGKGSKSLIHFSANLATTGYATLGTTNTTWQHEAEPPPNRLIVFYVAACALFNLPLPKYHCVSPQEYKVTKQHNSNS
eukprot:10048087-Ditylum_brightwellii.AAC.1